MTELERPYRLEVRQSVIDRRGGFAGEPIPAGGLIGEYVGELITTAEALKREADLSRPSILTFWIDDQWAIDGMFGGNDTIYLNHSCEPNCYCEVDPAARRVFMRAKRDIAAGEELTIDYAYDPAEPWEKCLCGAPTCRGYLNDIASVAAPPAPAAG
jgi:SET domain-containing protein